MSTVSLSIPWSTTIRETIDSIERTGSLPNVRGRRQRAEPAVIVTTNVKLLIEAGYTKGINAIWVDIAVTKSKTMSATSMFVYSKGMLHCHSYSGKRDIAHKNAMLIEYTDSKKTVNILIGRIDEVGTYLTSTTPLKYVLRLAFGCR
jgi:hypothetical protein